MGSQKEWWTRGLAGTGHCRSNREYGLGDTVCKCGSSCWWRHYVILPDGGAAGVDYAVGDNAAGILGIGHTIGGLMVAVVMVGLSWLLAMLPMTGDGKPHQSLFTPFSS